MPPKKENELPGRLKELKPVLDQPEEGVLFHQCFPGCCSLELQLQLNLSRYRPILLRNNSVVRSEKYAQTVVRVE